MVFERRSEGRGSDRSGGRSSGRGDGRSSGFSGGRSGGRSSGFGGGRSSGGRSSRGSTEMHSAVCDQCGSKCELPFKPTGDKPVLCSDCFRKAGPSGSRGSSSSVDLSEINAKLDRILELLSDDE